MQALFIDAGLDRAEEGRHADVARRHDPDRRRDHQGEGDGEEGPGAEHRAGAVAGAGLGQQEQGRQQGEDGEDQEDEGHGLLLPDLRVAVPPGRHPRLCPF